MKNLLEDKKKRLILVGAVILVALAAVLFVVLRKPAAVEEAATPQPEAAQPAQPAAATPAPAAAPTAAPAAAPAAGPVVVALAPLERSRQDPFAPFPRRRVPPPPEVIPVWAVPPITPGGGEGSRPAAPREVSRRLAGILWNDRAWAILETGGPNGETTVVKPGDMVGENGRVQVITRESIILQVEGEPARVIPLKSMERAPAAGAPAGGSGGGAPLF